MMIPDPFKWAKHHRTEYHNPESLKFIGQDIQIEYTIKKDTSNQNRQDSTAVETPLVPVQQAATQSISYVPKMRVVII
jgi:hypothetical protein